MDVKITEAYLVGAYPKSEELLKVMRRHAESKLTKEEMMEAVTSESREVVELQKSSGLTLFIDGLLLWHDIFRPFATALDGIEIGPLTRWFDNNVFYRKPRIISEIRWVKPILDEYVLAEVLNGHRAKVVIPDPFMMAKMSEDLYYKREEELVLDLAEALAKEVRSIASESWLKIVQLSAPLYVIKRLNDDEREVALEAIRCIRKAFNGKLTLQTFFGDLSNALPWILDADVDVIGLDLTVTKLSRLADYDFEKSVCVGVSDARNSYIESSKEILSAVERVANVLEPPELHISPNADLDFLPRSVAEKKVRSLGEAYREASEG